MKRLWCMAMLLGLAGCGSWNWWSGPVEQSRIPKDATLYRCDGGKRLAVRYEESGKSAMIIFPEREFRLNMAEGSAGARYTNGRTTLFSKDDDVRLEEGGTVTYDNCKKG